MKILQSIVLKTSPQIIVVSIVDGWIVDSMEESNLVRFFGNAPFTRILDALIDNIGEQYSKKEIQELSGLSKGAFFAHWPKLEQLHLVSVTKTIGKTKLFTLNKSSKLAKDILKFEMRMIEETTPKTPQMLQVRAH